MFTGLKSNVSGFSVPKSVRGLGLRTLRVEGVFQSRATNPLQKLEGSGFRVQGSGFRVQGSGFRVLGFEIKGFDIKGFYIKGLEIKGWK